MRTVEVKTAIGTKLRAVKFQRGDVTYTDGKIVFSPGVEKLWREWYTDKDWDNEILKMERWLLVNPPKINWVKFINTWMSRAQGKTGPKDKKPWEARDDRRDAPDFIQELADKWRAN